MKRLALVTSAGLLFLVIGGWRIATVAIVFAAAASMPSAAPPQRYRRPGSR